MSKQYLILWYPTVYAQFTGQPRTSTCSTFAPSNYICAVNVFCKSIYILFQEKFVHFKYIYKDLSSVIY